MLAWEIFGRKERQGALINLKGDSNWHGLGFLGRWSSEDCGGESRQMSEEVAGKINCSCDSQNTTEKLLPPNPRILLFTDTWGESIILDFASCQHYTQANICPNAPSPCRRQDCCYNDCQAVVLHLSEL